MNKIQPPGPAADAPQASKEPPAAGHPLSHRPSRLVSIGGAAALALARAAMRTATPVQNLARMEHRELKRIARWVLRDIDFARGALAQAERSGATVDAMGWRVQVKERRGLLQAVRHAIKVQAFSTVIAGDTPT